MSGGLSKVKSSDNDVDSIVNTLKSDIEEKLLKELIELKCDSYKTQVVAGVNYYIKAKIDKNEYIFLKVFRDLPHNNQKDKLISVQVDKKITDEIVFF